jgi:hypothetical protein
MAGLRRKFPLLDIDDAQSLAGHDQARIGGGIVDCQSIDVVSAAPLNIKGPPGEIRAGLIVGQGLHKGLLAQITL